MNLGIGLMLGIFDLAFATGRKWQTKGAVLKGFKINLVQPNYCPCTPRRHRCCRVYALVFRIDMVLTRALLNGHVVIKRPLIGVPLTPDRRTRQTDRDVSLVGL